MITNKHIIKIFFFVLLSISFNSRTLGQKIKNLYGDTVYIDKFNKAAIKMNLDDLTLIQDSIRIRMWNGGNLIDLKYDKNKVYGEKILYIFSYPKRIRHNYKSKIIFEKSILNKRDIDIIESCIDEFKKYNFVDYIINTDSISRRDGGVGACLELSDKYNYLLISESIWSYETNQLVDSLFNQLNMPNDHKVFFKKLPNGRRYTTGYTTGLIKLSFFGGLIERLKFWK